MTSHKPVIEFFNDDGSVTQYRPLSQRLPAFLAQYGPPQGYRVVIEVQDVWTLCAGRRALYEQAIAHGHSPQAVGLPAVATGVELVFQAKLLNAEGEVVASAAAWKSIVQYKDFEAGETAARQRLLAALGFSGEVLDDDENQDQTAQGLRIVPSNAEREKPTVEEPTADVDSPTVDAAASKSLKGIAPPAVAEAPAAGPHDALPPALRQQLAHHARIRGIAVPSVATVGEAKQALKQLLKP